MPRLAEKVVVYKPARVTRGWRKTRRACTVCDGAGMTPVPHAPLGVLACNGCNGYGYVYEWKKLVDGEAKSA